MNVSRGVVAVASISTVLVSILLMFASVPVFAQGSVSFKRRDYAVGSGPSVVTIGDFNGDGFRDLVTANKDASTGASTLSVLFNNGEGVFPNGHNDSNLPFSIPTSVAIGDFNDDGFMDIAIGQSGSISVLIANGDGSFQDPIVVPVGQDAVFGLVAGDFNGDGVSDLAATTGENNAVFVLLGNGDGTFQDPVGYAVGNEPINLVTGDFNGDGILDLVTSHNSATPGKQILSLLTGNGDGTFQPANDFGSEFFIPSQTLGVADFDNNGTLDLVVGNALLLGNGDGTFSDPIRFADIGGRLTVGDFDADGNPDVAIIDSESNEVVVHLGNGDGTFQSPIVVAVGEQPSSIASGRLASPNHDEIAVANSKSNTVSVLSLF